MTTGAWDPDSKTTISAVELDVQLLQRLLALAENGPMDDLASSMSEHDQRQNAIMQASTSQWEVALRDYSDSQLLALLRLFTLVEVQLSHWVGGAKSPVIAITAMLKKRGVKLDQDTLRWIRKNSSNRFIPNGAIL